MSKKRRKFKEGRDAEWLEIKSQLLETVRQEIGLDQDDVISDAVLILELDHYLPTHQPSGEPTPAFECREAWFFYRLSRLANTETERKELADALRPSLRSGRSTLGCLSRGPSRRSQQAGERRNALRKRSLISG